MDAKQTAAQERTADAIAATVAPIIAAIEAGIADPSAWRAPWHDMAPAALMPYNPSTEHHYTGGNRVALAMVTLRTGAAPHWGTFKQWQAIDAQVRKGETAAARILRPATAKRTNADGEETTHVFGYNAHAVFHAGQVDGYDMPAEPERDRPADNERDDIADAFTFAAGIGAKVIESDYSGASYSPTLDRVQMPERDRFATGHGAWSTMAHELCHWTGHETRLARTFGKRFGDDTYAAEELTAELGAAFTLAGIGRTSEPRADHSHYLAHWLRVLKADPSRLWTAAGHADRASTYLLERATIGAPREMVAA